MRKIIIIIFIFCFLIIGCKYTAKIIDIDNNIIYFVSEDNKRIYSLFIENAKNLFTINDYIKYDYKEIKFYNDCGCGQIKEDKNNVNMIYKIKQPNKLKSEEIMNIMWIIAACFSIICSIIYSITRFIKRKNK